MRAYRHLPLLVVLFLSAVPITADAGMYFDVEIKGIYEDNVVGLLSDRSAGSAPAGSGMSAGTTAAKTNTAMGPGSGPGQGGGAGAAAGGNREIGSSTTQNRDTAIDLFAALGGSTPVSPHLDLFLAGSAERITYSTFTEFNSTAGAVSTGLSRRFGAIHSARLALTGIVKGYDDPEKDASAYTAGGKLKQQLGNSFWIQEGYEYERSNAEAAYYSYKGRAAKFGLGYLVLTRTTLLAGYTYLVRVYDDPVDFKERVWSSWGGLEWEPVNNWFLVLQYDRQVSDTPVPETRNTNNITSVGLRYSY